MGSDSHNKQYTDSGAQLWSGDYASTGAPGSYSPGPDATAGDVIGTPEISVLGASSQVPSNHPAVPVRSGDTSGMSSDQPAYASALLPGPAGRYLSTGAGEGHAGHHPHPNNPHGSGG